jgi:hypothetical protein
MLMTSSPTESDAMGRSPPGVAMGVSGDAQVHGEEQRPSLPQAQHPESAPLSGKPMGPPGGKHGPDESPLERHVPGVHGSWEL